MRSAWPIDTIPKVKSLRAFELDDGKRLLAADKNVLAAQIDSETLVPFLRSGEDLMAHFPSVTVDMGAIKFVCNGANVTRPGITNFDLFKRGAIVIVKDQNHGKAIAVCKALEDSETAKNMSKGYVLDNLHYISDKLWEASKQI
jgi:PUA domain protein